MASMPPAAAPAAPDTSAAPDDSDAGGPESIDPSQGFTLEITCLPDGSFNVSAEPAQEEAAEEQGESGAEPGTQASSIGDALKAVIDLYKQIMSGSGAEGSESAGFDQGFGPKQKAPA